MERITENGSDSSVSLRRNTSNNGRRGLPMIQTDSEVCHDDSTPLSNSNPSEHRIKVRIVSARAYHSLFMHNMCIRPTPKELEEFGTPDFTIYNAGLFPCNRYTHYMTSSTSIDINIARKEMVILGTQYAGEMKKGLFGLMHYLMPKRYILSLHSGSNMGKDGDVALFFGLSGTEDGIKEPQATFSACFGAAFIMMPPTKYAAMLAEKMQKHGATGWLVNTGWSGGSYGLGNRIKLAYTRKIIVAIQSDKKTYQDTLLKLASLFKKNFDRFTTYKIGGDQKLTEEIVSAGPIF
ncbi:hypothetical protein JHK87_014704 [Glycine soja]|nr:hypothetical protein JHK87_014704 [Glycine soja]